MKTVVFTFFLALAFLGAQGQKTSKVPDSSKRIQVVETACGECQFEMKGKSCDLAVKIDGKSYFVDGTSIDDHGDAHAKDGFCNAVRKAEVQGEIVNGRFRASYFKLLEDKKKKVRKK
ncbi:DUF6370 family protein [Niabella drilacis]|uniref:Glutaminyl-tRNA synthetase n=1 Tax=Niabella drilacis (strain DSM 25811 / CCM 8410 / CCUG 62505 / LMG 26954 / E90) TaxID=1285928 RepID=A0A1G6PV96_NIADE|nr:DUF6370 family protein [Niabella drilacis]SDC84043.1 hypothetical protein SAMN04487894_104176 [Niabella drilacis]